ncbi:MAG: Bug family tripartite tricarboxylate transporter substrate binding protein [Burkholderiales bacterium]
MPCLALVFRAVTCLAAVAATLLAAAVAHAQPIWPTRAVRIVLPFAAGGSTDAIARALGQKLFEAWGQPVVIDNRPGAGGAIAAEHVAQGSMDGYTLLMATTSTQVLLPLVNRKLGYDPQREFAPIVLVAQAPNLLVASPTLAAGSLRELIALARAKPGAYSYASSGNGTITHLIGAAFAAAAGIKAVHAPYKTGVQALPDLVSGQISWAFDSIVWTLPQVRAGKLKGLAISSRERSPLAPELPTVLESGLPDFEGITWFALVVHSAVPRELIGRINADVNRILRSAEMKERLAGHGAEVSGGSPSDVWRAVRDDTARWERVIREAGIRIE